MTAALLKAIGIKGSRRNLAKAIGTTPDAINAWLNRGINIPLEYAIEIERVTTGEVTWKEVAPHLAHFAKRWAEFPITNRFLPIQTMHVALSRIKHTYQISAQSQLLYDLSDDIRCNGLKNPICIDTDNCLIYGEKRLHAYEVLQKKTIPAWRLSLTDLVNGEYNKDELCHTFTLSERVAISLAIEKLLGKRQGQRTQQTVRQNFVEVKGRTDHFIANLLSFGNRQTYNQAKKIVRLGCQELIDAIDRGSIAVSTGAILAQVSTNQQRQIITRPHKEVSAFINKLRSQHQFNPFKNDLLVEVTE